MRVGYFILDGFGKYCISTTSRFFRKFFIAQSFEKIAPLHLENVSI